MPVPLDKLSQQFRSAVLAGDHFGAEQLALQYIEALREMWESLPERERAVSLVPKQARELLAWARDVTTVQRALTQEQLAILEKACRYQPPGWQEPRSRAIDVQA
jgi:hypothetical protein